MNEPSLPVLGIWVLFGFLVAALASAALLFLLGRLNVRQHAYEDAPETHREKTGTPTMGGLVFLVVLLLVVLVATFATARVPLLPELVFLVVLCAGIGAIDDMLAIRQGANRGLSARTKLLATALAATIFMRLIGASPALFPPDVLFHGGGLWLSAPHWLWLVLGILAIVGTTHAVNLTDGLDGLAAGTMIPPLIVVALIGAQMAMIGAVFVAEALSVILQVTYFKATHGRRILRMSPLHHHFELSDWPETKVTTRFWVASAIASLVGLAIVR
jgi:phospho-N-acetylmuramoyl-pentapeptide-transferase